MQAVSICWKISCQFVRKSNLTGAWRDTASTTVLFTGKQKAGLLESCPALVEFFASLTVLLFTLQLYKNACTNVDVFHPTPFHSITDSSDCNNHTCLTSEWLHAQSIQPWGEWKTTEEDLTMVSPLKCGSSFTKVKAVQKPFIAFN